MLDKEKQRHFSFIKLLGTAIAMVSLGVPGVKAADISCFSGQRFPKTIQESEVPYNPDGAVTVFGDEAVYTGAGKKFGNESVNYSHIGRINLSNNQWAWHKEF